MSLQPLAIPPVPAETVRVARAAFPKGPPSLILRDTLGPIFQDEDFADLCPLVGQPRLPPWRLALVTILQFRGNLADRQAAEAVRARIAWKYLLGLELTGPGFDFAALSAFRARLHAGRAAEHSLDALLERGRALGLLKARGQQRTDSTPVLAAIRVLNRLALVAATLRAALHTLATVAPDWRQALAPLAWYARYGKRIEDTRRPREQAKRDAYAQTVGEDGFQLLDAMDAPEAPEGLRELLTVRALRQTWPRHYERSTGGAPTSGHPVASGVRFKPNRECPPAAEGVASPDAPEARYRHQRDTQWSGYMVHVSETCEPTAPHLLTQVYTTPATVREAMGTDAIAQALVAKALPPGAHLVDAADISAELLVSSRQPYGIELRGPTRQNTSWQTKGDGAYSIDQFAVDGERQEVWCPQGKQAVSWTESIDRAQSPWVSVQFSRKDCLACPTRAACTRAQHKARSLQRPPREQYEALQATRAWYASAEGTRQYARRAGIEGTRSQGVRAFGLRRARSRGLEKTHWPHVATAAAINIDRTVAWLDARSRAKPRTSRFAALAPV